MGADVWIPRLSLILAINSVLAGVYLQRANARDQLRLKRFEVTFLEKRKAFTAINLTLAEIFGHAASGHPLQDPDVPLDQQPERRDWWGKFARLWAKLDSDCYELRPFLNREGREWLLSEMKALSGEWLEFDMVLPDIVREANTKAHHERLDRFRERLFRYLFPEDQPDKPE